MIIKRHGAQGADGAPGARAQTAGPARATRRTALAGGFGITALIAFPDVLAGSIAQAATGAPAGTTAAAASGQAPHFFLYGTTGPLTHPGVEGRAAAASGQSAASHVVTGLDVAPVRSADGGTLALVSTSAGTSRAVTLTLVDTLTGTTASEHTVALPGASSAASILSTPVFAGTGTVALLIAVSEPSAPRTIQKNAANGGPAVVTGYAWTTSHLVAYVDRATSGVSGPHPLRLGANPYLALTDAAADASHLYLWAVQDYSRIRVGKGAAPALTTEFFAVPVGSGTPALAAASTGPWPSGFGARVLPGTGHVARVVAGRDLEVFSPADGSLRTVTVAPMHEVGAAKPGAITFDALPDGTAILTNSAFGRATVLDPAAGYRTVSAIDYPKVAYPVRGASVSGDGATLYTLGARATGGLNAYRIATGALTASYTHGEAYTGVYQLAGGNLLTLTSGQQTGLSFFTPQFTHVAAATTDVLVAGVY